MLYVITAETNKGNEVIAVADDENNANTLASGFVKEYTCVNIEGYSDCHILFDHDDKLVVINKNKK